MVQTRPTLARIPVRPRHGSRRRSTMVVCCTSTRGYASWNGRARKTEELLGTLDPVAARRVVAATAQVNPLVACIPCAQVASSSPSYSSKAAAAQVADVVVKLHPHSLPNRSPTQPPIHALCPARGHHWKVLASLGSPAAGQVRLLAWLGAECWLAIGRATDSPVVGLLHMLRLQPEITSATVNINEASAIVWIIRSNVERNFQVNLVLADWGLACREEEFAEAISKCEACPGDFMASSSERSADWGGGRS